MIRPTHAADGRFTRTEIADEIERVWGKRDIANWLRQMDAVDDAALEERLYEHAERPYRAPQSHHR